VGGLLHGRTPGVTAMFGEDEAVARPVHSYTRCLSGFSRLPTCHPLNRDDLSTCVVVQNTARLLLQPPGKLLCDDNAPWHEPGTDNVPILDLDSVAAQRPPAILAHLSDLSQEVCHQGHFQRPEDDEPAVFQSFEIEMTNGELVEHGWIIACQERK